MERYKNGKIYTIRSNQTNKFYIGSTCLDLYKRIYQHRANYKAYQKNNNKKYTTSFKILQYDDHYIELLEEYPCTSKMELEKKEGELIRQYLNDLVNKNIVGRTKKEWCKDNKNKIKKYDKQYYKNNKEQIKEQRKIKITCECGSLILIHNKKNHNKTNKHINYINNIDAISSDTNQ